METKVLAVLAQSETDARRSYEAHPFAGNFHAWAVATAIARAELTLRAELSSAGRKYIAEVLAQRADKQAVRS